MSVYLSPERIRDMLREAGPGVAPPEIRHFQFIVILADDGDAEKLPTIINAVMTTLVRRRATISNVLPPLFLALFGVPFPENNSAEARRALVDALLSEHGDRIRIAHGEADGPVGIFGKDHLIYGAIIPGLSEILRKLFETQFGIATEIGSKTPLG